MADSIDYKTLDATLDLVASWLLAAYGRRLSGISLSLEGHYGPLSECYGIVPIVVTRGVRSDGTPETKATLPTFEICNRAEALFMRLCPEVAFTHDSGRDVQHVASSRSLASGDISAHRRIELLRQFGSIPSAA